MEAQSKKRKRDTVLVEDQDETNSDSSPNAYKASVGKKSKHTLPLNEDELTEFQLKYRKSSEYALVRKKQVSDFLKSRTFRNRDEAIREFEKRDPKAAVIFRFLFHKFTAQQIQRLWAHAQRTGPWFKSRFGSRTGSEGGYLCNWSPYHNPVKFAFEKYWTKFKGNPATEHGSRSERLAAQIYANYVQVHLNKWFVEQKGFDTGVFIYRGRKIPLFKRKPTDKYFAPPVFTCRHIGGVRDCFNHQDQASIDLEGFINDVPVVVGEIKVPWALEQFFLYPNENLYYVPQSADGIRHMQRLWPTTFCADRITFSHLFGINTDLWIQDSHWYNDWFIPRSLRYYFGPQMEMLCEYICRLFKHVYPNTQMTVERLQEFIHKQWFVPFMETNEEAMKATKTKFDQPDFEENEIEFEQQLKYAQQHTVQFGVFPEPKPIIKPHDIYFSEMRMIQWRSKHVSLDYLLRHRLHTIHTPSLSVLLTHNVTQSIWKDEQSHFTRTYDSESIFAIKPDTLVESQQEYATFFASKILLQHICERLETDLRYRFDLYWCVFVAGMKLISPTAQYLSPTQTVAFGSVTKDGEIQKKDIERVTLPSLEMNEQFVAAQVA